MNTNSNEPPVGARSQPHHKYHQSLPMMRLGSKLLLSFFGQKKKSSYLFLAERGFFLGFQSFLNIFFISSLSTNGVAWRSCCQRKGGLVMAKIRPHDGAKSSTYQPLLDTESSLMFFLAEPAITTVTFFKGADAKTSSAWLKDRLTAICNVNPWLAGRLVKDKKVHKNILLEIPTPIPTDEDIDAIICNGDHTKLSQISSTNKYENVVNAILKSDAVVRPGYKLVGKRDRRVAKFTLVPTNNDEEVALIASITHTVSDGYTYYKIMSMLNGDIVELSPVRKHDFIKASIDAIGAKEYKFLSSTSFLICCLKSMLCGSKANIVLRLDILTKTR